MIALCLRFTEVILPSVRRIDTPGPRRRRLHSLSLSFIEIEIAQNTKSAPIHAPPFPRLRSRPTPLTTDRRRQLSQSHILVSASDARTAIKCTIRTNTCSHAPNGFPRTDAPALAHLDLSPSHHVAFFVKHLYISCTLSMHIHYRLAPRIVLFLSTIFASNLPARILHLHLPVRPPAYLVVLCCVWFLVFLFSFFILHSTS